MARHVATDLLDVCVFPGCFEDEASFEHDDYVIRQLQNLVQIFTDEQHGGAGVADLHYPVVNFCHGVQIESETGVLDGVVTLSEIGTMWTINQQAKSLKILASKFTIVGEFH